MLLPDDAPDPRMLSNTELDARLHDLQRRAFALYEAAAQRAEAQDGEAAYAHAETQAAPLIAQAKALNEERVRRLRARARRWRHAATAVGALGLGVIAWWMARG